MNSIQIKKYWIFTLYLCLVFSFYSCDKYGKLNETTWESDYFELEYKESFFTPPFQGEKLILRGKMTILFGENYSAYIILRDIDLYDKLNDIIYFMLDSPKQILANYTYKGKNLTIHFDNTSGYFAGQQWTGTISRKTINLRVVFGETVIFKKK